MTDDPIRVIIAVILVTTVLLMGLAITEELYTSTNGIETDRIREGVLLKGAGETVSIADGAGTSETVYKTTGYAVNLTGANDSFVQSDASFTVSEDKNWTVSLWARPDAESSTANMTALSLNGRLLIWWNGSAGNWSAWYFDEGSTNSFQVNVTDNGAAVGNYTNVIVRANGTHLEIYRNNTIGETENISSSTSSIASAPVNSTNWDGRLEEVRTFDEPLDSTNRSELVSSPVEQQPDLNRTSRIMFDQPDRDKQLILFTSASLTQSNVTFSAGFAEQIMDGQSIGNNILGTTDYIWNTVGPTIEPVSGGELDGAPVAYVTYDFEDTASEIKDGVINAINLGSLIPLLLMMLLLVGVLTRVRSKA